MLNNCRYKIIYEDVGQIIIIVDKQFDKNRQISTFFFRFVYDKLLFMSKIDLN